ncbi:MAG: NAD(P)H-hydrate dehydratase [Pyrinomonadaceae bacterium]
MQKVLTADQMREVDRLTTETFGIPSLLLMENAAHAAARAVAARFDGDLAGRSCLIFCGKGNNGGDGAALGRVLWQMGMNVEIVLIGLVSAASGDARTNFEIVQRISDHDQFKPECAELTFEEITSLEEWYEYDSVNFQSDDPDVIVDALFGTGLNKPLDGVYEQAAALIYSYNGSFEDGGPLIVSLDLPSGLCADRSTTEGVNPCPDLTVTFTAPKLANVMPPASNYCGDLVVACIGSPQELIDNAASQTFVAERSDVRKWLEATEFSYDSYKNRRGHALIVAGSADYAGAAVLCGNAAIRTGVGLVTVATPRSSANMIGSRVTPEVMVRGVPETDSGSVAVEAVEALDGFLDKIDVIAIGSGLSSGDESTRRFVQTMVRERTRPIILDADGLNVLTAEDLTPSGEHPLIITPHAGEFLKLLGTEDKSVLDDRVGAAREFAQLHKLILVLKGTRNLVAAPDGRVVVNPTGNAGLGKAGNGDTLTGIIAGFAGQAVKCGVDLFETTVAAVYIAGLAGDIAEEKYGKRVMTAGDVRGCLHDAFVAAAEED